MELDPTVIPIGAEIRSQAGDLIGRARSSHAVSGTGKLGRRPGRNSG